MMTFAELCEKPLGSADYIALTDRFHTVAIDGVPMFGPETKSAAYRFITLVDELYDNR